jgi:hypothetical protein
VHRDEQRNGVDAVAETTESQGKLDTKTIHERTGKETNDGKGTVEGSVLCTWLVSV